MPGQIIVDFIMTRHRLLLAGRRIDIDIMTSPVPVEDATLLRELPNEFTALHKVIAFVW